MDGGGLKGPAATILLKRKGNSPSVSEKSGAALLWLLVESGEGSVVNAGGSSAVTTAIKVMSSQTESKSCLTLLLYMRTHSAQ